MNVKIINTQIKITWNEDAFGIRCERYAECDVICGLRDDECKDNKYTNKYICNLNVDHMTKNVDKMTCSNFYWLLISKRYYPTNIYVIKNGQKTFSILIMQIFRCGT